MTTKLLVTTSAFVAGAVIEDGRVILADHWLGHLRNLTEEEFRAACAKNGWPVAVAPD